MRTRALGAVVVLVTLALTWAPPASATPDPCESNYAFNPPADFPPNNGSLPNGAVGHPYSEQIKVSGNTPPYLWQSTTVLPPGLGWAVTSSQGTTNNDILVISGTPTEEWQPGGPTIGFAVHDNQGGGGTSCASGRYWSIVIGLAPHNTTKPVISGTAEVGQQLSCNDGSWTGTPTITYTKSWVRNNVTVVGSGDTYDLTDADAASQITCGVTGHNDFPPDETAASDPVTVSCPITARPVRALMTSFTTTGTSTCSPQADLNVHVSGTPAEIFEADNATYTITVANEGPDAAEDVVATISDGSGATRLGATPSQGSCSSVTSCDLGTVAADAVATITVVVRAAVISNERTMTEQASATSSTPDPGPSTNEDSADTHVLVPAPKISVTPAELDFGRLSAAEYDGPEKTITIANIGNVDLSVPSCRMDATGAEVFEASINASPAARCEGQEPPLDMTLAPGASFEMRVQAHPEPGLQQGLLTIESSAGTAGVALVLEGLSPHLAVSPPTIDFGHQVVPFDGTPIPSDPETITVQNTGEVAATISSVHLESRARSPFAVVPAGRGGCTEDIVGAIQIGPGGSCRFAVVFTPVRVGKQAGTLVFDSNAVETGQTVGLEGEGARVAVIDVKPGKGVTDVAVGAAGPGEVDLFQLVAGGANGSAYAARGQRPLIVPVRKRVRKAGVYKLRVRPNRAGQKLLARRHRFTLPIKVVFKPRSGKTASTRARITIRR